MCFVDDVGQHLLQQKTQLLLAVWEITFMPISVQTNITPLLECVWKKEKKAGKKGTEIINEL